MNLVKSSYLPNVRHLLGLVSIVARRQIYSNAIYGVVDYLSLPIGMLLAAPFLLMHLGNTQYGIWILATAAVSGGGIVSSGFGDAAIKYVSTCRSLEDLAGVRKVVANMIAINLTLSSIFAVSLWSLAPYVTRHVVRADLTFQMVCLQSLRIGSVLLIVKSLESVFVSTLRAFETYSSPVRIGAISRAAILVGAVALAWKGYGVVWIMVFTLLVSICGLVAQGTALRAKIGFFSSFPSWHRDTLARIGAFGSFSWLQAIAAVVFSQVDRFMIGVVLGAPAVACYGLCIQAAQPIHGLIASGMHNLFPHLSAVHSVATPAELRHKVTKAFKLNLITVSVMTLPFMLFGKRILAAWLGNTLSHQSPYLFLTIILGFAFMGMNVTAHYTLLAIGKVKILTYISLVAGILMLVFMKMLLPIYGLQGAAIARLFYGSITLLTYYPLHKTVWSAQSNVVLTSSLAG